MCTVHVVRVPGLYSRWPRAESSSAHPFPGGHPDCRPGFVCAHGRTRDASARTTRAREPAGDHRPMNTMMLTTHGPWHDGNAPGWWPVFPIGFGLFWLLVLGGGFYLLLRRTRHGGESAEGVLAG